MKVVVCGGDGFCGWPISLHLSDRGHDVLIVDNLVRRAADIELGVTSLTPISSLEERLAAWKDVSGKEIRWLNLDLAKDYDQILQMIENERPDAIVHLAEQRAAPYSMKSSRHKRYTVDNNVNATHNILSAIVESGQDIHLVHIGTMGVYGYGSGGDTVIPEGYLTVQVESSVAAPVAREILHPTDPGSIYHMTKCLDQQLFYYYAKNDRLRISDLHQGIVWGTNTEQTNRDPRLVNRFDYDGDYGTVLNRFLVQAAIGYPLTVHGVGGQTRAFIHIRDTVRCIELALENPPRRGDRVRIHNQLTETHRIEDLAVMISKMTGVEIAYLSNPRNEAIRNELRVEARTLVELGLRPTRLEKGLLEEVIDIAGRHTDRCDRSKIPCVSLWTARPSEPITVERRIESIPGAPETVGSLQ